MSNFIVLAIFGAILYYIFKSYSRYEAYSKEAFKNFSTSYEAIKQSDLGLFVALVAKVAKADGRVDTLEAQLVGIMFDDISSIFPEPSKTKDILKQIFNEEKERLDNVSSLANRLAFSVKNDKQKQLQFMGFLIQLAFADGEVSKAEDEMLQTIAQALEFDPKIYHSLFDKFEEMIKQRQTSTQTSIEDAYATLGVDPDADMNVIKKAYRKLVREYHPDIIKSQNKGEEYLKEATRKTQEINEAYEIIKKARES